MIEINNTINTLDTLFSSHPSLGVLFSGIGVSVLLGIISFGKKIVKKTKSKNTDTEPCTYELNASEPKENSEIMYDINKIKQTLRIGLNQDQEDVYFTYFTKYKDYFSDSEITSLNNAVLDSKNEFYPYRKPLCILLGLLEKI